ncbi:unnamed protein product [Rotaria sp. Silwood1]|nr:unnamed protein product [Rotaria sp. Silwood1]
MHKQDHFERYTPQYPLPVDITNMSRQDTVCQFCGVSYLIHNEIKALEAKCQKLEADLAYYAGISSRENALEQTLQNERARISDLESNLAISTHKHNEMTRKLQLVHDQLEQSINAHQETKNSFSKYSSKLRLTRNQIQTIRKEYSILQDFYSNDIQNWKMYLQTVEITLQKETQIIMNKYTKQINNYQTEIEQYQQQLNEINQSFRDLQIKYQQSQLQLNESHTIIQNDLEAARGEIEIQKNELSYLREQISQYEQTKTQLQNDLEQTKRFAQQLERQLSDKDASKANSDLIIDQYRQQLTNEKELRLKADTELENIRSKFLQLTNDYEQLNLMKKEFETNELNTRRKIDEINRSRQAVLDRTRDEYEKLLRKYHDLDEVYHELVNLREKDTLELKTIRSELERLHNENIELTKQRETLHITHDIQMKKIHDTYSIKLREAEQWPDRLQTELNREREQHRIQIHELEQRLKENFLTELNIEKQKYTGLLRKYEHDSGYSTEQLRHELLSTEKVTIEQRHYYTKQIEQLEKDKIDLKKELDALRDVLKELHEQMNNQESMNNDRIHNLKLKEDLLAKETSLFQAQSTINELQQCLEQTREEHAKTIITFLFILIPIILLCVFKQFWYLFIILGICLIYGCWLLFDYRTDSKGGRWSNRFRRLCIWKQFANYFPLKLIKSEDLDPNRNYIFGYHPHGAFSLSAFGNFATDATQFSILFPNIRPHLMLLRLQFLFPCTRDLFLNLGACCVSRRSCEYLLSGKCGQGNALVIVLGGVPEMHATRNDTMIFYIKRRKGFVKLALKHGASLVPVISFGENELYERRTCFNLIPNGIPCGRSIVGHIPLRHPVITVVGKPIHVNKIVDPTATDIDQLHNEYIQAIEQLFEVNKCQYGLEHVNLEII